MTASTTSLVRRALLASGAFAWRLAAGASLAVSLAVPLVAQSSGVAVVSVRGVVFDSLRGRRVSGALVEIAGLPHTAMSDADGRFRIDSVPAGRHRLTFSAPALDSLGLFAFANDIEAGANSGDVQLATPSFATMYGRLCGPASTPSQDSAIVFGTVRDRESGAVVSAARVTLAWATAVGAAATNDVQLESSRDATTAADGSFGLCGLPSSRSLAAQAATTNAASARTSLTVGPARIIRHDIVVSTAIAPARTSTLAKATRQGAPGNDRRGFLARKRNGLGVFIEQPALEKLPNMGAALSRIPKLALQRDGGGYAFRAWASCPPLVRVDGVEINAPELAVPALDVREVVGVEYYGTRLTVAGNEALPSGNGCRGVLQIWTKNANW